MNDDLNDKIKKVYVDDIKTLTEIARELDLNPTTISNRLDKMGVPRRKAGRRRSLNLPEEDLKRLYVTEKKNFTEIAKYFGCSDSAVKRALKKNRNSS